MVERILRDGMPVNVRGSCGSTALLGATIYYQRNIIRLLIHEGADVNIPYPSLRNTPLRNMAMWDRNEIAQMLLDAGADINLQNKKNKTPLDLAGKGSKVERQLLQL